MSSASPRVPEPKPLAAEPAAPVLLPPMWLYLWWAAALVLIALWREPSVNESLLSFIRPSDNALANILTLLVGVMTVVASLVWLWVFSGHLVVVKLLPVALLVLFFSIFRFDGFTGEMWPKWAYRWVVADDQRVDSTAQTVGTADLAVVSSIDFPEFLGPGRAANVAGVKLARDWEKNPPREIARWDVGAGWAGFAVVNGFGVTLEQRKDDEVVTCYDIKTGKLAWLHAYPARHYNPMGGLGPRSTPTIHEGRVYAQGATGMLHCLDGATGKVLWKHDLFKEFGLDQGQAESILSWGRAGSPLLVDNLCVIPGGGPREKPVTLVAYNKVTGEEVWRGGDRQIGYASPTLATIAGVRQFLSVNEDTVTSHDPATGKVLWTYDFPGHSTSDANNSQPWALAGDRLFLSKGYGVGCQLVQVKLDGDKWSLTPIWQQANLLKTKFTNVVFHDGYIYGLDDGILECVELESGDRKWKRGRYEQGQVLLVGDTLLVQAESGDVVLVDTNPDKLDELAKLPAMSSQTWNNPAFASPYLVVRNAREAVCYELPLAK